MRRLLDRLIVALARVVAIGFFPGLEVVGREHARGRGPTLYLANHFNGLVDPVVMVAGLRRLPRFLAKATLWKVWPARPLYALAGIVPVQRRVDGEGTAGNVSAFARCHEVLRRGGAVAVFPEGTTHDELELAPLRTGAARIALGARAEGIEGIRIVPVGILYENKLAVRSRALVRVGEPLLLDDEVAALDAPGGTQGEDDQPLVRALTERFTEALAAVSPRFESVEEWRTLAYASEVALRRPDHRVDLAEREELAQLLAAAPAPAREEVADRVARYHLDLSFLQLDDDLLVARTLPARLLRELVTTGVLVALTVAFALVGALVNVLPLLVVLAASSSIRVPVTKGTVRTLVAVVVFPLAWFGVAARLTDGFWKVVVTGIAFAAAGLLAVITWENIVRLARNLRAWGRRTDARGTLEPALAARDAVVAAVAAAAPGGPVP